MKKRPLGQNFLVDQQIAQEIVNHAGIGKVPAVLEIGPGISTAKRSPVLEIGPGKGILTRHLLKVANPLTALEIDPKLCTQLKDWFSENENFHLIQADAIKFDYGKIGDRFQVVSNLPYYAATHILKRLIDYRSRIVDMTLMLQKEVVDRLVAGPGQKEYGSLSIYVQFHCNIERRMEIPKTAFSPQPKIDSSLIKLTPLATPRVHVDDEKTFFKVVHAAFFHKRKMLKNNLQVWENHFKRENDSLRLAGIDLSRRGETLSMEDFAALSNFIQSQHDG
jgi:16S rRNA (adenine1518-N6/adenine1519-N6)-dimethyltransferase